MTSVVFAAVAMYKLCPPGMLGPVSSPFVANEVSDALPPGVIHNVGRAGKTKAHRDG